MSRQVQRTQSRSRSSSFALDAVSREVRPQPPGPSSRGLFRAIFYVSLLLLLLLLLLLAAHFLQARLGSALGYDTVAKAAHGTGVAIHAHQFSLWLEASLRRVGGATARLTPPFERLVTSPGRALAAAAAGSAKGSPRLGTAARFFGGGLQAGRGETGAGYQAEEKEGDDGAERGRRESRSGRQRRGWKRRSSGGARAGGAVTGFKDGMTWVPRALPKLSHSLGGRGGAAEQGQQQEDEEEGEGGRRAPGGGGGGGSAGGVGEEGTTDRAGAHTFDELWLPPGLVTLAQDVLLINRARGGMVVRGDERYFIAQARGAPGGGGGGGTAAAAASESGSSLWKPAASKFRGLEAAVFPFLLLPLVPADHQAQAAGQLSRLLDANPANAAVLCHLRVPLALLKLACLLPEQSQVRDLYFRLAAQLMSHHISAADALELFHLASLQPSAWARLGRLTVTSGADLISPRSASGAAAGAGEGATADPPDEVRVRHGGGGKGNGTAVLPPHSGELQMQLLYVIGTVVDSPSPAWFFHMDGGAGSGLVAGPLPRFPPRRVGYSLSMWLRPAGFSGRPGGETGLLSICGRRENGAARTLLRVSLRRYLRPGDGGSAPPAAAGIGASEDDDGDQGAASEDACAQLQLYASTDEPPSGGGGSPAVSAAGGGGSTPASAFVAEPDVRCNRWQCLVLTHSYPPADTAGSKERWMDGSVAVYVDGERRALTAESGGGGGKSKRGEVRHGALAYPAAAGGGTGSVWVSVGCWEACSGSGSGGGREVAAAPMMDAGVASPSVARFSGQVAAVALVEGAWTAETAKASFLRGPGAPPPGKRVVFASPGDLPPSPFLDAVGDVEATSGLVDSRGVVPDNKETKLPAVRGGAEAGVVEAAATGITGQGGFAAAPFSGVSSDAHAPREGRIVPADSRPPSSSAGSPPGLPGWPSPATPSPPPPPRLSVMFAPVRRAIDLKYGVAPAGGSPPPGKPSQLGSERGGAERGSRNGAGNGAESPADGEAAAGGGVDSVALTVSSLAVAAGCGGRDKESACDRRASFRLAKRSGTWVYATTPLHAAVQAAGGFRLCLPFLRMDHARQVCM